MWQLAGWIFCGWEAGNAARLSIFDRFDRVGLRLKKRFA
jgi:hypothetical protein